MKYKRADRHRRRDLTIHLRHRDPGSRRRRKEDLRAIIMDQYNYN
jgi:hypothetical protein